MERSHSRRKDGAKNNAVKRRKQMQYKQREKRMIKDTGGSYGFGGCIVNEGTDKEYTKNISAGDKKIRNQYNRKVRRDKENLYQGSDYRKYADYAWEIW